jgi:hypothetical protein
MVVVEGGIPKSRCAEWRIEILSTHSKGARCRIHVFVDGQDTGIRFRLNHHATAATKDAVWNILHEFNRDDDPKYHPTPEQQRFRETHEILPQRSI